MTSIPRSTKAEELLYRLGALFSLRRKISYSALQRHRNIHNGSPDLCARAPLRKEAHFIQQVDLQLADLVA